MSPKDGTVKVTLSGDTRPVVNELADAGDRIEAIAATGMRKRVEAHERYIRRHIATTADVWGGLARSLPWWRPLRWKARRMARATAQLEQHAHAEAQRRVA